jgi:drug/metabolite transporter (DMT)-like permease
MGFRRFIPNYWANWLGSALFGVVGISFVCWGLYYAFDQQVANGIVALALAGALAYMVYLFGSTRLRD